MASVQVGQKNYLIKKKKLKERRMFLDPVGEHESIKGIVGEKRGPESDEL